MRTGLNGWLGRFIKRAIVKVAGFVDSTLNTSTFGVSSEIGSFQSWAEEIGSGGSSFWSRLSNNTSNIDNLDNLANDPRGNYEPTDLEAIELENFSDQLAKIITDISKEQLQAISVFNNNSASIFYKYSLINSLLQRTAVIKEYYKYNETRNLSIQAIELRNLIVEVLVSKIIKEVEDLGWTNANYRLQNKLVTISSGNAVSELLPYSRKTATSLAINYYSFIEGKEYQLNPTDESDILIPIDTTNDDTQNTPTTSTPKQKKSGLGLFAGLLFGTAVLIVATNNDDKKKKPKQK